MDGQTVEILHEDKNIIVCYKPAGVLSEEGSGPNAVTALKVQTGRKEIYTVHRLDTPTSGLMVYACTQRSASDLSRQIVSGDFGKEYLCVVSGVPEKPEGHFTDLLYYDRRMSKSFVADRERNGVKRADLDYFLTGTADDGKGHTLSLLRVKLQTGRTHQIRVQCASRKMPVVGDGKYGSTVNSGGIALLSYRLSFMDHEGKRCVFELPMPDTYPWNLFR